MFIIVTVWGGRARKIRASYMLFFFTLLGSIIMLLAMLKLYIECGTLDIRALKIIIFEESLEDQYFLNCKVCKDFEKFKKVSDIVIANRMSDNLNSISEKVFTRDIFQLD